MKKIILLFLLFIPIKVSCISATSAILMDMDSGRILYSDNINEKRSVASISKIMTAVIAIESDKLDNTVTIGNEIEKSYGSGIYIKEGETLTLRDLLYGLMLRSGNDAAISIATYISGNEEDFVKLMNRKAKEIGMKNTTFNNSSGLEQEKGNYSTAYDMAKLMSYAMKLKEFKTITKTKVYKLKTNKNTYRWVNKNKLLKKYKYTTGGKTGYTEIAKRTLVTTASKNGLNLVVVTLNDGNDWNDHIELFEYGFSNYKNYIIAKKGKLNIYDNRYYSTYNLIINNNVTYPLTDEEKGNILIKYSLYKNIQDNNIGEMKVYLGDKTIISEKIYSKKKKRKLW